jgi:hypothetical protein
VHDVTAPRASDVVGHVTSRTTLSATAMAVSGTLPLLVTRNVYVMA